MKKDKEIKETIKKEDEKELTIVNLKDSNIELLIPYGYRKLKYKNPIKEVASSIANDMQPFQKIVENSNNTLCIIKADKDKKMAFDGLNDLIKGIHECLSEEQGLIEAKAGTTNRGYKYIYSIVKTINKERMGESYFLRLNIGTEDDVVEVQGQFDEIGTTGMRDTLGMEFARRAGLIDMTGDNPFDGWNIDPYDPEYKKGIPMNLSEKAGLDGIFPYHPLTQARELLLALLEDKFVIIKKENDNNGEDNSEEPKEEMSEKEMLSKLFEDGKTARHTYDIDVNEYLEKKMNIDKQLNAALEQYNVQYIALNDVGTQLFHQREKSADLITYIEELINSIANTPKSFENDFVEIKQNKEEFKSAIEYANEELSAAKKSAAGSGAGIAAGTAVASMAPTAAMWIATTFGTASTGAAISTLSGAAATNAALAWLGGGAIVTGGGGMAGGTALLALAGPIGWGIAGASILTSIALFARKKIKLNAEKNKELLDVKSNIEKIKEVTVETEALKEKTTALFTELNNEFINCISLAGSDYARLNNDEQLQLGTLVNNTKGLSVLLKEKVSNGTDNKE